jgi:large subunit ribosomal protein L25
MATEQIDTKARTKTGKGASRRLRSAGRLPGIFYGPDTDPIMLSVDSSQLKKMLKGRSAESIIFDLRIDSNGASQSKKVMIKEIQRDPVTRDYLHVDFYEISMGKEIEANIPIQLINIPVGVTKGGLVEHTRRELTVSCLPRDLVETIDVDVSGLDIGDALHIRDIVLPPGVKSIEDEDLTIATVGAPTITAKEEEVEGEEVEETEREEIGGDEES